MKYKKEVFRAKFLKLFVDYKILTLDFLKKKLGCSAFHIQSMLNNVGYHVSFTDNNKWYTLSNIPEFNEKGFWFFNEIGFSKHGNMGQTILYFINKSENGLTAKEIKEIISKKCLSILNIMFKKDQLERISGNNGYIYFLKKTQKQKIEKIQLLEAKKASMPSDIDAIHILVALIQNPNSSPSDLSLVLKDKISCNLDSITTLFQHFGLGKKNGRLLNKVLLGYLKTVLNGVSIEKLFQLPSDLIRQFDFTEDLKVALLSASDNLKGHQKRSFISLTAHAFGPGGQRFVENELEWNRGTIRKGKHELKSNIICIDNFGGRGRKSAEEHLPHLLEDITSIVKPISQADPTFKSTKLYIPITAESVYNSLIEEKHYSVEELPTIRTIGKKLDDLNYHPKLIKKCIPIKKIPETDMIFDEVHRINKFVDCHDGFLRISIDSKAKVKIGPFSRGGKNRQGENACDHDFAPKYILSLFGIFLPLYNLTYFFFSKSKDPADFIVDCLQSLWPVFKEAYHPHTLVINLDNGPECNSHRTQLLKRIVEFAFKNNVNIILAYYPPYHSKYNPIERVWGVLEKLWGGVILNTIEKALGIASSMKYNNVQAVVNFVEKEYFSGVKVNKKDLKYYESKIKRKPGLEKWFAEIIVRPTSTAEEKFEITKDLILTK